MVKPSTPRSAIIWLVASRMALVVASRLRAKADFGAAIELLPSLRCSVILTQARPPCQFGGSATSDAQPRRPSRDFAFFAAGREAARPSAGGSSACALGAAGTRGLCGDW